MADRYNVRNVAQKEVYDSYMGILRISPNLVYKVDEDDATNMLHTLADFRNEYGDEVQEIKVQVSDSDGNMLPVYFIPRAFATNVTLRKEGNNYTSLENIINICTWSNNSIYISNKMDIRSTLSLKIKKPDDQKNISLLTIISGGQKNTTSEYPHANSILQYPIENPNDDFFFNKDNNRYTIDNNPNKFLFDENSDVPRHEQMESNLFNQTLNWHKDVIEKEKERTGQDPQVIVDGKYINTFNVHNEDVPVFYTRDYVLGHYEGHTVKGKQEFANVKDEWIDSQTSVYDITFDENSSFTRLSWIRIDNLIWDAMDEIVSGKIRHNGNGRYIDMGAQSKEGTQIIEELFGIGLKNGEEGFSQLSSKTGISALDNTAPILGQGVQEGLIMYHAMPLHRYWFHRCRQIIYNMERWSEMSDKSWSDYEGIIDEINNLETYKNNSLITCSCRASVTPHHSLVKDFLICNGQTVNFENYPNISLTNTNLLINDSPGKEAEPNKETHKFDNRISGTHTWDYGTYGAIKGSISDGDYIKTPNLLSFNETYPRFIRSMSWDTQEEYVNPDKEVNTSTYDLTEYGSKLQNSNSYWIHSDQFEKDENGELTDKAWSDIKNDADLWGITGVNIKKPITHVSLHHYNYDFASKKKNHYHNLFSKMAGGEGNNPFNKKYKWSELAAFYTWGSYGGVAFKVAPNECNTNGTPDYYNGNEHGSGDYNYGSTYCLALTANYDNTTGINAKAWTEYCLKPTKNQTFHDFTPISNMGLLLWNGDLLNNKFENYIGTTEDVENGNSGFYYTTYYTLDIKENTIQNFVTEKIELKSLGVGNLKTEENAIKLRTKRFKRKQQAIKLNEAEGRIPISVIGHAKYRMEEGHMIERKRSWGSRTFGGDDYDTEPITVYKNNIGNYTLKGVRIPTDTTSNWGWSCLTSLPFEFPEFLGYGDWKAIDDESYNKAYNIDCKLTNPTKYYINHNVTDRWKRIKPSEKVQIVKYGGVELTSDIQSPTPSHLYLLPLIRL